MLSLPYRIRQQIRSCHQQFDRGISSNAHLDHCDRLHLEHLVGRHLHLSIHIQTTAGGQRGFTARPGQSVMTRSGMASDLLSPIPSSSGRSLISTTISSAFICLLCFAFYRVAENFAEYFVNFYKKKKLIFSILHPLF